MESKHLSEERELNATLATRSWDRYLMIWE